MIFDFRLVDNLCGRLVTGSGAMDKRYLCTLFLGRSKLNARIVTTYRGPAPLRYEAESRLLALTEMVVISTTWDPTAAGASVREFSLISLPASSVIPDMA